jgi:hypothetical protein
MNSSGKSDPSDFRLPEVLKRYGQPLSIHRPWTQVVDDAQRKLVRAIFGENWQLNSVFVEQVCLLVLGGLMVPAGLVVLGIYLFNPPEKDAIFALICALILLVLGTLGLILGIFRRRFAASFKEASPAQRGKRTFVVYAEGLAAASADSHEFMAWRDVQELANVWAGMDRQLTLTDAAGRKLVIDRGLAEEGELTLAIHQRVHAVQLPKALARIKAGETVSFGPFAVSQRGLKYKDKATTWNDIASMEVHAGKGGRRLTIYTTDGWLAWCWHDLNDVPNDDTFFDVLSHTAPERLLTQSTRPRW